MLVMTEKHKEVKKLAREVMGSYGLRHWEFVFINSFTKIGKCRYPIGQFRGRICVSWHFTWRNSINDNLTVILHECAHALTSTEPESHGPKFQAVCKTMGIPWDDSWIEGPTDRGPRYVALCPVCRGQDVRIRRPQRNEPRPFCSYCLPSKVELEWERVLDPDDEYYGAKWIAKCDTCQTTWRKYFECRSPQTICWNCIDLKSILNWKMVREGPALRTYAYTPSRSRYAGRFH